MNAGALQLGYDCAGQSTIGAKLALFVGKNLVVILRDNKPDIPFPSHWDFPGGGWEPGESPLGCALRETKEELGLLVSPSAVTYGRRYDNSGGASWFFAAHLPEEAEADIRFGDEGQCWKFMTPEDYLDHERAIPNFQKRLRMYLQFLTLNGSPTQKAPRA